MEYARLKTSTGEVLEVRNFATAPEPLAIPHKDVDWRPVTRIKPAFNDATEVREGPVTTVAANGVEIKWTVRAKTAQELDADKVAMIAGQFDGADKAIATALFQVVNDVRVLRGQGAITAQQFRDYLKGLL